MTTCIMVLGISFPLQECHAVPACPQVGSTVKKSGHGRKLADLVDAPSAYSNTKMTWMKASGKIVEDAPFFFGSPGGHFGEQSVIDCCTKIRRASIVYLH